MNFSRAFSYAFDDRDWLVKLLVGGIITLLAILLTPLLVGLALWALVLSYLVLLVRNVRAGVARPLPAWGNFGKMLRDGLPVLGAATLYNLPNLLLSACIAILTPTLNQSFTGAATSLGLACCVLPLTLIYNAIAWPMLALALARHGERREAAVLFDFAGLFTTARANGEATTQYVLWTLLATVLFILLALIPCAGWVAVPALALPVHGYLMGEYAARVLGRPQFAPGRPAPSPKRPPAPSAYRR